jgi:hypothetical protein
VLCLFSGVKLSTLKLSLVSFAPPRVFFLSSLSLQTELPSLPFLTPATSRACLEAVCWSGACCQPFAHSKLVSFRI